MRTFIAIELPTTLHAVIRQQQERLASHLATAHLDRAVSWTPPVKVHLTLRFLGETSDRQRQALQATLAAISAAQYPFSLSIGAIGCFPSWQSPAVIWLGLHDPTGSLVPFQQKIEQAAQAAGYAAEPKFFAPHLTIGRVHRSLTRPQRKALGQTLTQQIAADPPVPPTSFEVDEMVHMQSQLQTGGAVYTPIEIFKFVGK